MQVLVNLVMEPSPRIGINKKTLAGKNGEAFYVYELVFELERGPVTILLPQDFAIGIRDKLIEAVSGLTVPKLVS